MIADDRDAPEELTPRQAARQRARERKRSTRMVVDSAGLKRTALALAQRRAATANRPQPEDPAAS